MEKLIKDYGLFIVGAIAIYWFLIRKDDEEISGYTTSRSAKGKCCKCGDGTSCCGNCPDCCNNSGGVVSEVNPLKTDKRIKKKPEYMSRFTVLGKRRGKAPRTGENTERKLKERYVGNDLWILTYAEGDNTPSTGWNRPPRNLVRSSRIN